MMLIFSTIYSRYLHSMGMFLDDAIQFSDMASIVTATHVDERVM